METELKLPLKEAARRKKMIPVNQLFQFVRYINKLVKFGRKTDVKYYPQLARYYAKREEILAKAKEKYRKNKL